jgi:hypothetical protein
MNHEQATNVFLKHALPGMTLKAPSPPLVKRCGCGKQISGTRSRCMACQQEVLQELASQIDGQDLLDAMLGRSFPEMREEMLDALRPYLTFDAMRRAGVQGGHAEARPGVAG